MSTETHIKLYLEEIEMAYKEAVTAVGKLKDKIDAFRQKAQSISPDLRNALEIGEQKIDELEQKTKETDQKTTAGNKTPSASATDESKS